jgi:hypothetical protein
MPPDRVRHLISAAKQRHELTRAKAIRAIRQLDRDGATITFGAVARTAQVSRSWLYTQVDIRDEIWKLRTTTPSPTRSAAPAAQRASAESLRRRLATMQERIHNLAEENQRLRHQLAVALGEQRAGTPLSPAVRSHHSSATIKRL